MDDPNDSTAAAAPAAGDAVVAPAVRLLTRRKAQATGAAAASSKTAAAAAAVKVENNDSQDEPDAPVVDNAAPTLSAAASPATPALPSRMSTRRRQIVRRPVINVDALSDDDDEFTGFAPAQQSANGVGQRGPLVAVPAAAVAAAAAAATKTPTAAAKAGANSKRIIKEEPLSDHEPPVDIKLEVKMEHETEDDVDEVAAAAVAVEPLAAAAATRRSKRVATPPRTSAAAAAVAAAIIEQHLSSPALNAAAAAAAVFNAATITGSGGSGAGATGASNNKSTPTAGSGVSDPRYRKPFACGWRRELVYRAHNDVHRKTYDKAEVYYITPAGKKLRTRGDILSNLSEGLEANDFTFAREPIGMSAEEEIIRSAKLQTPSAKHRPVNFLDLGEPDPMLGFGKRVPKPKMPKGASPPPMQQHQQQQAMQRMDVEVLVQSPSTAPKAGAAGTRGRDEPCTIQCVLAMGTIPQLQCRKCLCLFHPECVRRSGAAAPSANHYVCESCLQEASDAITVGTATSVASSSASVSVPAAVAAAAVATVTGPAPPSAASKPQPQTHGETAAVPTSSTSSSTASAAASQAVTAPSASAPSNGAVSAPTRNVAAAPTATAAAADRQHREQLDINDKPAQSIAIVAGRKYIMVPKAALMSVSPSGDCHIGDGSNGMSLGSGAEALGSKRNSTNSQAPTTGDQQPQQSDTAPPPPSKKRNLAARGTNATHSPGQPAAAAAAPSSSNHAATATSNANANATAPNKRQRLAATNAATVHTLFAVDFFANVSTGYAVLANIFQYLKVQELLRAACVCRMWNQVAHTQPLWRTVRMKNSQVGDWSGAVSTLRRNGTRHLDLRKMPLAPVAAAPSADGAAHPDDAWLPFSEHIGRLADLEQIDLCRVPAAVVERLMASNGALRTLNAVTIRSERLQLPEAVLRRLTQLRELRLKAINGMHIVGGLPPALGALRELRHLSLTSLRELKLEHTLALGDLGERLESLELGDCNELAAGFGETVLRRLRKLQRLRLEKGTDRCPVFEIVDTVAAMPALQQLELVNFDIKTEFDEHLRACTNVRRLLVIPTYISQSATTNRMVMAAVLQLGATLQQLKWVVTTELLSVTKLYVDKCDGKQPRRDRRLGDEKIPVMKPVPGVAERERGGAEAQATGAATTTAATAEVTVGGGGVAPPAQVEIVPLERVHRILAAHLPRTNFAIVRQPFHTTWRQTLTEAPAAAAATTTQTAPAGGAQ